MGIGSRSHCLLGEACKSLAISSIDARGNDDNTLEGRGGLEWGGMGEGLDESLRRRVETLLEKNEANDSARDGFGVEDGSEVVCLRCSMVFMLYYFMLWSY